MSRTLFAWLSPILLIPGILTGADRITGHPDATRSQVIAQNGMVASSHPLATQIGLDILKRGGNAVDAAIAVNAALGLMEPTGSGIGGDLFAIVWDSKTHQLYGLNASGPSPKRLSLKILREKGRKRVPTFGPLSWTVPGCVDGWFKLHRRFGKLKMKQILAPAIQYAEAGFPLTQLIVHYWNRSIDRFKEYPNFQKLYNPYQRHFREGDIFKNPHLAETYRMLGKHGRDAFYRGKIARKIVQYSKRIGGYFELSDLADFKSEWVQPLSINYKGYDVWELPPNGQGIAVLQILQMLNQLDVRKLGLHTADYLHTLIELKKIVYEDRARFYADPKFVKLDMKRLLSEAYAKERLKLFDPLKASKRIPHGDRILEHGDTVYLTVVDKDRNAISLIQSNYYGFGSGNVPDDLGFCIQDRGTLFSLESGHPNVFEPGKRPFHTIIPAFVTKNGKPVFSFGVMGGSMQPQGHVQVLLNIIDFKLNIQEAGDLPRFRHGGSSQPHFGRMSDGGAVSLEMGIPFHVRRDLTGRGHLLIQANGGFGGYQGIWIDWDRGILIGASETRKDGCAIGY